MKFQRESLIKLDKLDTTIAQIQKSIKGLHEYNTMTKQAIFETRDIVAEVGKKVDGLEGQEERQEGMQRSQQRVLEEWSLCSLKQESNLKRIK